MSSLFRCAVSKGLWVYISLGPLLYQVVSDCLCSIQPGFHIPGFQQVRILLVRVVTPDSGKAVRLQFLKNLIPPFLPRFLNDLFLSEICAICGSLSNCICKDLLDASR